MGRDSALRVLESLAKAKAGGYWLAWYFYVNRADVEALALAQVNATERAVYAKAVA